MVYFKKLKFISHSGSVRRLCKEAIPSFEDPFNIMVLLF